MKYRLLELLQSPCCLDALDLTAAETRRGAPSKVFPCRWYCGLEKTPAIPVLSRCAECWSMEVVEGSLACRNCRRTFPIVDTVPWLFLPQGPQEPGQLSRTAKLYGCLWQSAAANGEVGSTHADAVEEALGEPIVRGTMGLDAGSGSGQDSAAMARRHPSVEVISLDLSEGVYATKRRTHGLANVHVVRGSVLALPLRDGVCDFVYAFGVLHHTPDPAGGLGEIVRALKAGGFVSLYLYEDHADNPWKALPLKLVSGMRHLTTRLHPVVLSALCYLLSPLIVIVFSVPARLMKRFGPTRAIADRMPFNFGTALFSVHGDLLDRFGAPVEVRYSQAGVMGLLEASGLGGIETAKLRTSAGWVARGTKPAERVDPPPIDCAHRSVGMSGSSRQQERG